MTPRPLPPAAALLSWTTLAGVGGAAAGLAWDAILHVRDPLLAAHEGVLTTTNPAHVMLAAGLALAIVSQAGAIVLRLSGMSRSIFTALFAVFAVTVGTALGWSQQQAIRQSAAAGKLVADTRAGIAKYSNVNVAIRAGYEPMTPMNGPLVEWVNPGFTKAGHLLDVQRPERLMYVSAPGGLMLAGAMFVLPDRASPPAIAGAHWHRHLDLCYLATATIAGTNGYGAPCPAGSTARPTPLMLHVWIVPNPQGAFADDLMPAAIGALFSRE
ncbi:MAG: hypothetical protein PVSMB9_01600 [Candidatus Dormibacteria bacterium]